MNEKQYNNIGTHILYNFETCIIKRLFFLCG